MKFSNKNRFLNYENEIKGILQIPLRLLIGIEKQKELNSFSYFCVPLSNSGKFEIIQLQKN